MNNRKLKFIILPLLVITLISVLALASCNKETVGDIYIPKNDSPRVVYVEGQDLDLSKGSLTVVIDGEESSVPLNSADVTISGYNKDLVGKQTLTVSYKEKSISLEVTVIAKVVAEGYETNYFIGDNFNATKGKLRLARDNGTTFSVNINEKGVEIVRVLLHVGLGTFRPVKEDDLSNHTMHAEYIKVTKEAADKINQIRARGGRIIAVGTTSVRTLESASDENGFVSPCEKETSIFIHPGVKFKCVDAIITNFHLPESTLIMLVCAFAGYENTMNAYNEAVKERYRFFSFGDAMFIQ